MVEGSTILLSTFLINFLFLLIPFVVYFVFCDYRNLKNYSLTFTLLASVTMVLCLLFPIHLHSGFIVDLLYIPFILVGLYLGFKNILFLYIVLNICRTLIGGEGIIQSFLYSTLVLIVVSLCHRKFKQLNVKPRIIFGSVLALLNVLFYLFTLQFQVPDNKEFWMLAINLTSTYFIMSFIIFSLIERILQNLRTREKIAQSEKFHVISELSASVAHEIRNPLTNTSGFLQLLSNSNSISENDKGYIDYSLQELQRAEKIVSDFLTFSKPQDDLLEETNLIEDIKYAKNILIPYANMHHVQMKISFHNSLHRKLNTTLMGQCFINLFKNGIEAMKDSGGILCIKVLEHKNNIIIKITDSGIGMDEQEILSIAKPYYSTKNDGTGLGMVIVYNAIHNVGGQVNVESSKGKGTTFTITIPV